jgi:hypothetical protein
VLLHQEPAGVCIQRRVGPVGVSNMIGWDPGLYNGYGMIRQMQAGLVYSSRDIADHGCV